MNTLDFIEERFEIEFHGPFRVATGDSEGGFDSTINVDEAVPASSVKGLFRASAQRLLGADHGLVAAVFGSRGEPSPWAWSIEFDQDPDQSVPNPRLGVRTRIAIDDKTGTVVEGALQVAQFAEATTATVTVEAIGWIDDSRIEDHRKLLVASACSTTSLGSDRNRGYGWIRIRSTGNIDPGTLAEWVIDQREKQNR